MSAARVDDVHVLRLSLHDRLVGYLTGFQHGKNVLGFAEDFASDPGRPVFSLITHPAFPRSATIMSEPWARHQRLHPVLSNLLPEGTLRELMAQGLKIHADNEFHFLSHLGADLPGALIAEPIDPGDVPDSVFMTHGNVRATRFEKVSPDNKFSLAGVQMKFSTKEKDGRYNLSKGDSLGDWIVKTPSSLYKDVPLNEFTAMRLAESVGINIPDITLVDLDKLDNLLPIKLPDEQMALAIKRFDRDTDRRIHMEDFAQVLVKYAHEKYNSANYEQIGRIIHEYSADGLADAQQFARRLLANILLANGDAHLKNWSLVYPDTFTPRLSPAYDIVTTLVYIKGERQFALNLGKTKDWYDVSMEHFRSWADRAEIPWRAIKPHLDDVMDKARTLWQEALKNLPMNETHKRILKAHWGNLHEDFRIK